MADVNPVSRLTSDDRGQLFLVTALAIAVMLVSLALILNTAIYTENIATRTTDTQLDDALSGQRALVEASGQILDAENRNDDNESATEIESEFNSSLTNWSTTAGTLESANGFTVHVSYTETSTTGVRVHQDDPARNFTDASGATNWDLANNEEVRAIRLNVSQSSLNSTRSDAFRLVIDGDDDVTVFVHANDSNVVVTVEDDSGDVVGSCEVEPTRGDSLVVDVGGRTVGTRYCAPLETVHNAVDGEADVRFENGDEAEGTYELYMTDRNTSLAALLGLTHYESADSSSWPVAQPALYDANVTYIFYSSGTTVKKEIRIAPGEL
ncbi:hypothetical protein [Haloferax sp. DFSO52]|uniref:DUF7261 family protein n=1 Tax=Haloferax sp. DFSO52 TaxID=3388505 RepID=UPI003A8A4342